MSKAQNASSYLFPPKFPLGALSLPRGVGWGGGGVEWEGGSEGGDILYLWLIHVDV